MEDSSSLLFELSNDERMTILKNLCKEKLKLSHIAKIQDITATEASRHLQRLSDARLIQKDVDGFFHLTKYGQINLSLLDSLFFTSGNRQYFLDHDASVLPYQFINGLGELSVSSFQGDFITTFAYVEGMMRSAEEYVYAMEEQFHVNAPPIITEKMKLGVVFRTILPETLFRLPAFDPQRVSRGGCCRVLRLMSL
jgi:predicted transcriptional regulator